MDSYFPAILIRAKTPSFRLCLIMRIAAYFLTSRITPQSIYVRSTYLGVQAKPRTLRVGKS